jgi:hypothetical protein
MNDVSITNPNTAAAKKTLSSGDASTFSFSVDDTDAA